MSGEGIRLRNKGVSLCVCVFVVHTLALIPTVLTHDATLSHGS